MIYPIRICRLKNMEIWELRLGEADGVFCYFSLVDNTLLNLDNEKENYLAIDIHTNVDLQNYSNVDYEELITMNLRSNNALLSIDNEITIFDDGLKKFYSLFYWFSDLQYKDLKKEMYFELLLEIWIG